MKNWIEPPPISIPDELGTIVGGHSLVVETLIRRGIQDVAAARSFLNPENYSPTSSWELSGMEAAVER
ncbi:MAG: hypothetical protein PVF74_11420, partial [Anaerolineales bacterium]